MNYLKKLEGKIALVSAAGQGIGFQIAKDFLENGCNVIAHYFTSENGISELKNIAEKEKRGLIVLKADLTSEEEVKQLVKEVSKNTDKIDILVNNAGGLVARKKLEAIENDFWHTVMDRNMTSMMMLTRELLPLLNKAGSASIINISSLAGRKGGHPGSLAYATSKGAVITWTKALAAELAINGIRVNCVTPGLILGTAFHETHSTKEAIEKNISQIPLRRAGYPADVSRAILFLASEFDGFITGISLDINGGSYMA